MILLKHFSVLFIALLLGSNFHTVETPTELRNSTFVSSIDNEDLKQHFLTSFDDISDIQTIQLYQKEDAYVYQINGADMQGQASVEYAIIPTEVMGDADPTTFLACTCYINNMNWRRYKGKYLCDLICIGFPF